MRSRTVAMVFLGLLPVQAGTYFVDYDLGRDSNTGLTQDTAWKHAPGDPNATNIARGKTLQPGDTVMFKGGVVYRGVVQVTAGGTAVNPIRFKGDGWGTGKARIEGADVWRPIWTRCPSAAFCLGNPNFDRIYYAPAPSSFPDFRTGFYEDGDFLWYSQGPKPSDSLYYDNIYEHYSIPRGSSSIRQTRTSITDANRLTQSDPAFWNDAYVITWAQGNVARVRAITSFNPSNNTLTHEDLGSGPYTDRSSYYSLLNHVTLITRPGEYAYVPSQNRIYVWPRGSSHPNGQEYSVQVRDTAFPISASNVVVEGFDIQHFAQAVQAGSSALVGVIVRNNEISNLRSGDRYAVNINASDSRIEQNRIVNGQRTVGIIAGGSRNMIIRSNLVNRTSRQGIWLMGASRSQVVNNTIADIRGLHANGLSLYAGSSDILVAHNVITQTLIPVTFEDGRDFTFFGNIIDGGNSSIATYDWFGTSGQVSFINNTFVRVSGNSAVNVLTSGGAQYLFYNNILHGGGPASSTHDYNLFVSSPAGWNLSANEELRTSLQQVFVSPGSNWRPVAGSPAIDRGTNPSGSLPTAIFPSFDFSRDLDGKPRAANGAWDRGAYEYANAAPDTTAPILSGISAGSISSSRAIISWTTDEPATSVVEYGLSTAYGSRTETASLGTSHNIVLDNLLADREYHCQVRSKDAAGNVGTSNDFLFRTMAPDTTPPNVTMTSPAGGAVVSEQATLSVNATDADSGVAQVRFYANNSLLGQGSLTAGSSYALSWNTRSMTNGIYFLSAVARDGEGNERTSPTISITVQNAAADLRTALAAHWRLDEGSGSQVMSAVGDLPPGSLQGGATWSAGKFAQGVGFDGVDDHVLVADAAALRVAGNATFTMWVRHSRLPASGGFMFYLEKGQNDHDNYGIGIQNTPSGIRAFFEFEDTSGQYRFHQSTSLPLSVDQWTHVAVVVEEGDGMVRFYRDGIASGSSPLAASINAFASHALQIGRQNMAGYEWPFAGTMDEIRVYTRSLSSGEVQTLFSATRPQPPQGLRITNP